MNIAPTGIAAVNIDGTTVNTGLGIPVNAGLVLPKLSDRLKCNFREKYCELKVVIIDEISMVSNKRLFHMHSRLCEIFTVGMDVPFGGISVIAVGDLYQLPPIRERFVFSAFKEEMLNLCHPWNHFKYYELTETMRQQGDEQFITLLNNVRKGSPAETDVELLQTRHVIGVPPSDSLYLYAENIPKDEKNLLKLAELPGFEYKIDAVDENPVSVPAFKIEQAANRCQSQTGGLCKTLILKINAKVMLTNNIDIEDRLINGQIGTVKEFKFNSNGEISLVYVHFSESTVGIKAKKTDRYAFEHNYVPIKRIKAKTPICLFKPHHIILRTQFPLMLSWACTIHKVQGLTLPNVIVSVELQKQRCFNFGQLYVAFSRVKSLRNLHISGYVNERIMRADPNVTNEYQRLKINRSLDITKVKTDSFKISLLNIRSLQKHTLDLASD